MRWFSTRERRDRVWERGHRRRVQCDPHLALGPTCARQRPGGCGAAVRCRRLEDEGDGLLQALLTSDFIPFVLHHFAIIGIPPARTKAWSDIQPQAARPSALHRAIVEAP